MSEQAIELSTIVTRLERVERENRWLKLAGVVLLLGAGALVLMGQAQASRTVEAQRFILRDQEGKIIAELTMDARNSPSLAFYDGAGKKAANYGSHDLVINGPFDAATRVSGDHLSIASPDGHIDLHPQKLLIGTTRGGGANASLSIERSLRGNDGPSLWLAGMGGKGLVQLNANDGPLLLMDQGTTGTLKDLSPRGMVEIDAGQPRVSVEDEHGFVATMGHSQLAGKNTGKRVDTSAASVVLSGKGGLLWSAP